MGEFGGVCMPNSPLELAKTQLETLAACKKWCKINGAPNLDWSDIDLSTNPGEVGSPCLVFVFCLPGGEANLIGWFD